ncbi:PDCD7-like protein [Mya arenaria]|uniref:PDCD7-like protein n=1 Tax=Mya arenaria TaxID=6604 RepID=A0ABY7DQZ1_MYAAR|nr:PDCD7-like protein [Mya arenaria]
MRGPPPHMPEFSSGSRFSNPGPHNDNNQNVRHRFGPPIAPFTGHNVNINIRIPPPRDFNHQPHLGNNFQNQGNVYQSQPQGNQPHFHNTNPMNQAGSQPVPRLPVPQNFRDDIGPRLQTSIQNFDDKLFPFNQVVIDENKDKHDDQIWINNAQKKTREMIVLLARLQKQKSMLETMKNEDASIWDQKMKELLNIKTEVEKLQTEMTDGEKLKTLHKKINKRRKKRARVKRLRQQVREECQAELSAREEKHALIDKQMHQIVEKQRAQKQEQDMQKEADVILGQVRRKLTEASRAQQLLDGLQKLRKLRSDRLDRQGVLGSVAGGQGGSEARKLLFDNKMSTLSDLLTSRLKTYKAEESTLQVLLEQEQQETREKEEERAQQRLHDKHVRQRAREDVMVFGDHRRAQPGDPIYSFQQFYESASSSVEALISIRSDWDMYLATPGTPGASCIPDHWVLPPEPSSQAWTRTLDNNT